MAEWMQDLVLERMNQNQSKNKLTALQLRQYE